MLAGAEWLFPAIFYNYLAMKGLIVIQLLLSWQEECQIIQIITQEKFWLWFTNYESFT